MDLIGKMTAEHVQEKEDIKEKWASAPSPIVLSPAKVLYTRE